eukprot:122987-Chlamydomonas_euryale.AAC.2
MARLNFLMCWASCRSTQEPALLGHGWGANDPGWGCKLSRYWPQQRSRDGSRATGLGPPAGGPRPSGGPSRMKSSVRPVGDL